jgi:hypothetical protein
LLPTEKRDWRGDAADSGTVNETSWDAVTIAWNNGKVASVHHGDMRSIQRSEEVAFYRTLENAYREDARAKLG